MDLELGRWEQWKPSYKLWLKRQADRKISKPDESEKQGRRSFEDSLDKIVRNKASKREEGKINRFEQRFKTIILAKVSEIMILLDIFSIHPQIINNNTKHGVSASHGTRQGQLQNRHPQTNLPP